MKTKFLVITHSNFTKMFVEVMESLNLPIELKILEAGFGEVNKLIDLETISTYDIVITSGAHLELIKREFHELFYTTPIFPLRFTEADLVKSLVQAKGYGNKILLMFYNEETYDLDLYSNILGIELVRLYFKDLEEAENLLKKYQSKGFHTVVGTSSICEVAKKVGSHSVLVYSPDSMKLELLKAYQLGSMRNKMMKYGKLKEVLFHAYNSPLFLLDTQGQISDVNASGITYFNKRSKHEMIGENVNAFLSSPLNLEEFTEGKKRDTQIHIHKNSHIKETTVPIHSQARLDGFITIVERVSGERDLNIKTDTKTFHSKYEFKDIVVHSHNMKKVIVKAKQYAHSEAPVLIFGESGTGKELLAHSIHQHSPRHAFPFLPVNCAAIPHNILESELFGYEEGSFTGALKGGKQGFFEMAQGGTIFLDEIGEIPLEIQTKLLRVLQEKEIIKVGGRKIIPLNIRVITATNKSLPDLIRRGLFREDLYYRINVLQINVPSLRERKEDILSILKHLLLKYGNTKEHIDYILKIGKGKIISYNWPGNIRELENFTQRLSALISISTTSYDIAAFFHDVIEEYLVAADSDCKRSEPYSSSFLKDNERKKIMDCLIACNGNKNEAASQLGISRTSLWRKMKEYHLN